MLKRLMAAALIAVAVAGCATNQEASVAKDTEAVTVSAENFRLALLTPTREKLDPLLADNVTYGHSAGKVDTKTSLVNDLVDPTKPAFSTISITDQTVRVLPGDIALVRHTFTTDLVEPNKPTIKLTLKILGVWQKQSGQWKLIARQAVRPPA